MILLYLSINLFINMALPGLLSLQPERLRLGYSYAWMWLPGDVEVWDLQIVAQGPLDQWVLGVDHATATIDLGALLDRHFSAAEVRASGGTFRYRVRILEEEVLDPTVDPVAEGSSSKPPIPGFTNPPHPAPEDLYDRPAYFWPVEIHDIRLDGLREVWVQDFRFVGDAAATGNFTFRQDTHVGVQGLVLSIADGQVGLDSAPVLKEIHGQVDLEIDGFNPKVMTGQEAFRFFSAHVAVKAITQDIRFLGFYLTKAPWVQLSGGRGNLEIDMYMDRGMLRQGSKLSVDAQGILGRWYGYDARGDGLVQFVVEEAEGEPQSRMTVDFSHYAIHRDGEDRPLVEGNFLKVTAASPDVALDRPFTRVTLDLQLKGAKVENFAVYNIYLPRDLGLSLRGGSGSVNAALRVSTEDNIASGAMSLDGAGVLAQLDKLALRANVALHAHLARGNLDLGSYDISGSTLKLTGVRVVDSGKNSRETDDSKAWWAELKVPDGHIYAGAPTFLNALLTVQARDTVPLITLFSAKKKLPPWVRLMLGVKGVSGKARVLVGEDRFTLQEFAAKAGPFRVQLRMQVTGNSGRSLVLVRLGPLAMAMRVAGAEREVHFIGATRWYKKQKSP